MKWDSLVSKVSWGQGLEGGDSTLEMQLTQEGGLGHRGSGGHTNRLRRPTGV